MRRRDILLTLGLALLSGRAAATDLSARLAEASRGGRLQTPTADEQRAAQALFAAALDGGDALQLAAQAAALEMHFTQQDGLRLLAELPGARRGRGFYALRERPSAGLVLQMPHSFKDLRTREIGLALFAEGPFDAAAWNTVPRRQRIDGEDIDSDLAHLAASWFNAFTLALRRRPLTLLQLHGFAAERRHNPPAAILSNASRWPDPALRRLAGCLETAVGRRVAIYPEEAGELGGTTNAQAAILAGCSHCRFVHLEMDLELREALLREPGLRARLIGCLAEGLPA